MPLKSTKYRIIKSSEYFLISPKKYLKLLKKDPKHWTVLNNYSCNYFFVLPYSFAKNFWLKTTIQGVDNQRVQTENIKQKKKKILNKK